MWVSTTLKTTVSGAVLLGAGVLLLAAWVAQRRSRKKRIWRKSSYIKYKDVRIIDSVEEWETAHREIMQHVAVSKVLGMDCEWVLKRRVALLQLASAQGLCVLVRLFKLGPIFPQSLMTLLSNKSILKVGVAVMDDGRKLHQDYGLKVLGCVDLRHVLKRVRGAYNCPSQGLQGLSKGILGLEISKDHYIRCGNWEAETYSQRQIDYAATDAAVAVDIFLTLVRTRMEMSRCSRDSAGPNRSCIENAQNISLAPHEPFSGVVLEVTSNEEYSAANQFEPTDSNDDSLLCDENAEEPMKRQGSCNLQKKDFLSKHHQSDSLSTVSSNHSLNLRTDETLPVSAEYDQRFEEVAQSMCQGIVDVAYLYNIKVKEGKEPNGALKATKKKESVSSYSTRRRPLWDNCRLEAPDGKVLCTCDVRKAEWYLIKELGDITCDDPLTVRLRFEPSNRPHNERNYYLQEKDNVCVVCGHDRDYVRKFVVPFEYKKYFPSALKDHSSHDVLLMCVTCHRRSCDFDSTLRLSLAQECGAPVQSGAAAKSFVDFDLQKVRSAGRALKLNRASIPQNRVEELEQLLLNFFGVDSLSEELILQASEIDARRTADDFIPHGKLVVRHMVRNGGLLAFQARWRQHFLDTMNPQFLPAFWSVDFVPESWVRE